jgi:DNA polymerase III subunit epsilon
MILFFDTETTGVPKNYNAPITDLNNWPRAVQIAWTIYQGAGDCIYERSAIIKPEGFEIPEEASKVHHITTEQAIREGQDLATILAAFVIDMTTVDALAGHNINFDVHILGAEFIRCNIENPIHTKPCICTMMRSTAFCKLPGKYGYKWPKLEELYQKLFNKPLVDAHDALIDIQATAECFFELQRLGIITI